MEAALALVKVIRLRSIDERTILRHVTGLTSRLNDGLTHAGASLLRIREQNLRSTSARQRAFHFTGRFIVDRADPSAQHLRARRLGLSSYGH